MAHPARTRHGRAHRRSVGAGRPTTPAAAGSETKRTFPGLARWPRRLDGSTRRRADHDRFFLLVDEFDPHEPFDTPEPWASRYDESWDGPHLIWPPYTDGAIRKGVLTDDQARQVRAQYGAKLSMIDAWFGRLLDALDRGDLWDDTVVIVCTDHGHFLGEKDIWGKPSVPVYEPLGHIPLFVAWPGRPAGCLRRADDERGPARHDRRRLRRHLGPSHPRSLARAAR